VDPRPHGVHDLVAGRLLVERAVAVVEGAPLLVVGLGDGTNVPLGKEGDPPSLTVENLSLNVNLASSPNLLQTFRMRVRDYNLSSRICATVTWPASWPGSPSLPAHTMASLQATIWGNGGKRNSLGYCIFLKIFLCGRNRTSI